METADYDMEPSDYDIESADYDTETADCGMKTTCYGMESADHDMITVKNCTKKCDIFNCIHIYDYIFFNLWLIIITKVHG